MLCVEGGAGGGFGFRVSGNFNDEKVELDVEGAGSFLGFGGAGLLSAGVSNWDVSLERGEEGDISRKKQAEPTGKDGWKSRHSWVGVKERGFMPELVCLWGSSSIFSSSVCFRMMGMDSGCSTSSNSRL